VLSKGGFSQGGWFCLPSARILWSDFIWRSRCSFWPSRFVGFFSQDFESVLIRGFPLRFFLFPFVEPPSPPFLSPGDSLSLEVDVSIPPWLWNLPHFFRPIPPFPSPTFRGSLDFLPGVRTECTFPPNGTWSGLPGRGPFFFRTSTP